MNQNQKRAFKGIWIPEEIWLDKELNIMEKLFLVEIDSLDNEQGCWASNKYFSEFFGISKSRASQIINSLKDKNLIEISYTRDGKEIKKRVIKVVNKLNTLVNKLNYPIKNIKGGYLENAKENNTIINNINKNNTNDQNHNSLSNRFEVLWNLYPNKKGKKKAFDAYKRAIKNGTTDEEIKQGIESYNKEIAYKHTKPMYIAHGSTWFNNQRWLDEYEAPKKLGFTSDASQNLNEVEIPEETYQEVNEMYERGEPLNQTIIIQLNEWRKAKGLGAIA